MYVLPYGQMSLWGENYCAPNGFSKLNIESNILIYNLIIPIQNSCFETQLDCYAEKNKNSKVNKFKSSQRIGPHDIDILSILTGSLLGDAYGEKHGNGTRICFQQEEKNSSYLLWFHKILSDRGYCNKAIPKLTTRLGKKGKLRYLSRFKTYTYSSFNWIHEIFYSEGENKKIVPQIISEFLTPLALAIWIQDDGGKVSSGLKIATNSFTFEEVKFLAEVLRVKYKLKVSVIKANSKVNQYNLYISKYSMENLAYLIKPYLHTTMYYKLNGYI